jgi:hypothetical protein
MVHLRHAIQDSTDEGAAHVTGAEDCYANGHQNFEVTAPSEAEETSAQYFANTPVV